MDIELIKKIVLLLSQIGTIVFGVLSLINLKKIKKKDEEITKKIFREVHGHEDKENWNKSGRKNSLCREMSYMQQENRNKLFRASYS